MRERGYELNVIMRSDDSDTVRVARGRGRRRRDRAAADRRSRREPRPARARRRLRRARARARLASRAPAHAGARRASRELVQAVCASDLLRRQSAAGLASRLTTSSSPSTQRRVAPHAQARIHRALPGRDVEVPLVPRAAHERVQARHAQLVANPLDGVDDLAARAERRGAVRAAVGEREERSLHAVDADRVAAELDQPALALGGRLAERQARLAQRSSSPSQTTAGTGRR